MADDVSVKFGANIEGVIAGVNDIKAQIGSLADSAESIRSTFAGVGTALAELFAVDQIAAYAEHMSDLGEQAIRMSSMLGISVEDVQKLGFAAKMTGGDTEGMAMSMGRFERNIAEAQSGTGKAYEAFHNLGISLEDLKTKTPDQLLGQVADAFARTADGATKYAYAVDLGGRTWGQMIPLLDQGSSGLQKMGDTATQTGSILTSEMAEAFERTHQGIVVMDASMQGVSITLFDSFLPAINAIIQGLTDLAQWFNEAAKSGGSMREIILLIEAAFDGLVMGIESGVVGAKTAIEGLGLAFFDLKETADGVVAAIVDLFEGLGRVIKDALTGNLGAIRSDYAQAINQMKTDWAAAMHEMGQAADEFGNDTIMSWAKLQQRANEMWAALSGGGKAASSPGVNKPGLPPAPTGASGKDDSSEDNEHTRAEMELEQLRFQQKVQDIDAEFNLQQITETRKIELLTQAANEQYGIDQKALDDALRTDQEYNDQSAILYQKHILEISKLNEQLAAAQKKEYEAELAPWKQLMGDMGSAYNTWVNGIISGSQTVTQATARAFSDMEVKFTEILAKMTAEFLVFEATSGKGLLGFGTSNPFAALGGAGAAAGGAAGGASAAAQAAALTANTAALAAGTAATAGSTLATTANTTTTATTGAQGLLATIENTTATLANTIALDAQKVASFIGSFLPSFDVGSWSVPGDMVAQIHGGEMIIPAGPAAAIRSGSASLGASTGSASGAGTFNITIQAIDTQTGAQFLKNNMAVIAAGMSTAVRNGNSNLMSALKS